MNMRFTLGLLVLGTMGVLGCSSSESSQATNDKAGTGPTASSKPLVVGFSQVGAESGWRSANSVSIQEEAKKRGIDLKFSDAQGDQLNQIKAIRSFIAQKVDAIAFSPIVETGFTEVLKEAKEAGIPVFISDRRLDSPEDLYVTFIGSDFVEEGRMAGEWLATKMKGQARIAELVGKVGSAPANDRRDGFADVLTKNPGMKIIKSQTANFERAKGKEVMEAFLKSPEGSQINALYAHNDDMAMGAIQAIEAAGKKPGTDIIIVSVDGMRFAFDAIIEGKLNCTVECNPLLGPSIFDAIEKHLKGEKLEKNTVMKDRLFDDTTAKAELPNRKY
jgi:galactofuranose transport system substrate-binding protein